MKIRVLMISFNRAAYTEMALAQLCKTANDNVEIYLWDNNSNQETKDVIKKYEHHKNVAKVVYNNKNDRLRVPTNWFWENYGDCDFLGKVDDDCLVPDNWVESLTKAHDDVPGFGILGCWHYLQEDFIEEYASKKIIQFDHHQVMRNCWVGGSGYLMKGEIVKELGFLRERESFTDYCIRAADKGYVNGWYFPFLYQEHMDDPRALHTGIKTKEDFDKLVPLTAKNFGVKSVADWAEWMKKDARKLQLFSYDPSDFLGFWPRVRRKLLKLCKKEYLPLVK